MPLEYKNSTLAEEGGCEWKWVALRHALIFIPFNSNVLILIISIYILVILSEMRPWIMRAEWILSLIPEQLHENFVLWNKKNTQMWWLYGNLLDLYFEISM